MNCKYFFLVCHIFFDFAYCYFCPHPGLLVCHADFFFFRELNLSTISLTAFGFCIIVLKRLPHSDVIGEFFPNRFIVLHSALKSLIHLKCMLV